MANTTPDITDIIVQHVVWDGWVLTSCLTLFLSPEIFTILSFIYDFVGS